MPEDQTSWSDYYAFHAKRPARPFVTEAMEQWGPVDRLQAVDLGCGTGSEAMALLEAGYRVLAVDNEPEAIAITEGRTPEHLRDRLQAVVSSIDEVELPACHLVHAGFSLPFLAPDAFSRTWEGIRRAVRPGGVVLVNLFGDKDSWAVNPDMTFQDRAAMEALFDGWAIERLEVQDEDGDSISGPKHWHLWHVWARKR